MSHTKEPWAMEQTEKVESNLDVFIRDSHGDGIAWAYNEANARRIVACVNACVGFSTEHLEKSYDGVSMDLRFVTDLQASCISRLEIQRDELVAALNEIASWRDGPEVSGHFDEPGSAFIARKALAKIGITEAGAK